LVIRAYSGDASPFQVRYGPTLADPPGALSRPAVLGYVATLLLSGGWLGLFAPLALLPTLPGLALNVLSTSPWMATGKAHYSGLVLPFLAVGAGFGLSRLGAWPRLRTFVVGVLVTGSLASYALAGAGPLAANYAP